MGIDPTNKAAKKPARARLRGVWYLISMAGREGFEPPSDGFGIRHIVQLCYLPLDRIRGSGETDRTCTGYYADHNRARI